MIPARPRRGSAPFSLRTRTHVQTCTVFYSLSLSNSSVTTWVYRGLARCVPSGYQREELSRLLLFAELHCEKRAPHLRPLEKNRRSKRTAWTLPRKTRTAQICKPLVRKAGLEPARVSPPDPKSGASANSATFAIPGSIIPLRESRTLGFRSRRQTANACLIRLRSETYG